MTLAHLIFRLASARGRECRVVLLEEEVVCYGQPQEEWPELEAPSQEWPELKAPFQEGAELGSRSRANQFG